MSTLIFDIETIGEDFDALDKTTQESLTRWIKKEDGEKYEQSLDDIKQGLGFSALTGQIAAIGVLDDEKNQAVVYYQSLGTSTTESKEDSVTYKPMGEKEMLELFWKGVKEYQQFVSFNGRGFDIPFLMVRSAIHGIRSSKDLMSNRYLSYQKNGSLHIDLFDQLTFYGAVRRKGNLHLWSRAFGIKSPKEDGVSGDDVARLFKEGKYLEIARYNVGDLRATQELYHRWGDYMAFG